MVSTRSELLPRQFPQNLRKAASAASASPLLLECAAAGVDKIYDLLHTSANGLSDADADHRRLEFGPNVVVQDTGHGWQRLLFNALVNPLVILLVVLAGLSFFADDLRAATVMLVMVVLGVSLRFVQERRADLAAAKLKAMIQVTATVVREGVPRETALAELVPGDVVRLAAGDLIPADLRLVACKDLHVIQSSLTGEAFPVEKTDAPQDTKGKAALECRNTCFLGTSVETGSGIGVIVATGTKTHFGSIAKGVTEQQPPSSFDKGVSHFTWLMITIMAIMVPLVLVINWLTKGNFKEAFFFAMAIAVGLTPEMLPMIVTVCLARGAMTMSRHRVIVKRLNSIQNLGAMDVLCTDKTGTLTMDKIILEKHCDVVLRETEDVLALAYLNSYFQTGLKNVMDRAILDHKHLVEKLDIFHLEKADEIPFDFVRKVMSVIVKMPGGKHRLICKGAPEEIFRRCDSFELDGEQRPMQQVIIEDLREEYLNLSTNGFRVLALAFKDVDPKPSYGKDDETKLVLKGYLAFLDPPKDSTMPALKALRAQGVSVKVLTGDNELVSRKICGDVGLDIDHVLLGNQIESMNDDQLAEAAEPTVLFARLSPGHKQRIIKALRAKAHVVGFLGDGINDAPALRAADVGISVDTAVDIAKESADAILLEKSLMVLSEGVGEGRKVFVNILKYIRMGASSNFGNMFSVLGASIFLPFLPMQAIQLLANNLLYDFSQVPIPTDDVDPEQVAKPRPWSIGQIAKFILLIGPCSSIFDYTTFFIMLYVFGCASTFGMSKEQLETGPGLASVQLFQTGWLVESLLTQTLIIHVIRTNRIPFLQSRASWPLLMTTVLIMLLGVWLPFSPIAEALDLQPLPNLYWPFIAATLLGYVVLTQLVKTWLLRRGWI
jgi:P-type Mg2+ transporter